MCIKWAASDKLAIYWWVHQDQRLSWALVKPVWRNNHNHTDTASCHIPYHTTSYQVSYNMTICYDTVYYTILYCCCAQASIIQCLFHYLGTFRSPAININSPFPSQLLVSSQVHLRCSRTFCLSNHALVGITITSAATYCSWRADEQERGLCCELVTTSWTRQND